MTARDSASFARCRCAVAREAPTASAISTAVIGRFAASSASRILLVVDDRVPDADPVPEDEASWRVRRRRSRSASHPVALPVAAIPGVAA